MSRLFIIILFFLGGLSVQGQSTYFIYLQSEPAQLFSVSCNGQLFSSSASGYIILPNLTDSVLQLTIGFPERKLPEQSFTLQTQRNDQGYLLKDYGDKGWGLLDWRLLSVTYSRRSLPARTNPVSTSGKEDFATLLSRASGDNSLLSEWPAEKKVTTDLAPVKPVSPASASENVVAATPPPEKALIPASAPAIEMATTPKSPHEEKPKGEVKTEENSKAQAMEVPPYCKSILTESEFKEATEKARVVKSETSKVSLLREFLDGRCFTTQQVKTITLWLTTDEVKYDFLLEVWAQTADRSQFLGLSSVFTSPSFVDRFKEMFQ